MSTNICVLLLLLAAFSCSDKRLVNDNGTSDLDEFNSYHLDLNLPKENFTDLIESVELMQFEETDESLLSSIRKISRVNGDFVFSTENKVSNSASGKEIYIFDENGSFKNKINHQGPGPEEYISINDLWVEDGLLTVYSMPKSMIYRYSPEGDFIDFRQLPDQLRVGGIRPYKDAYIVEMNFNPINDTSYYKFAKLDRELKLEETFLKYDNAPDELMGFIAYSTVIPSQDGVQLFKVFSDTVYNFKNDELTPLVHLNFKENWFWADKDQPTSQELDKVETENKVWFSSVSIGPKKIFANALIGYSHWEYFLIDRMSGNVKRMEMPKGKSVYEEFYYLGWEEDRLMLFVTSSDVSGILSALDENQIKYREGTTLEEIESSENPVLMWVKFKEE
jgi:hypothetical protein